MEQKENECWHPVAYASHALNKSEQNYCQLEKEILSTVFACTKFMIISMVNLFTCKMTIFHANQYLQTIVKLSPRIQIFLLHLQKHNFEMHYIQGSLLTVADRLSRATLTDCQTEVNENNETALFILQFQIT